MVKKVWGYVYSFRYNRWTGQTDGLDRQTPHEGIGCACIGSCSKNEWLLQTTNCKYVKFVRYYWVVTKVWSMNAVVNWFDINKTICLQNSAWVISTGVHSCPWRHLADHKLTQGKVNGYKTTACLMTFYIISQNFCWRIYLRTYWYTCIM